MTQSDAIIDDWLASFSAALHSGQASSVADFFEPEGFWRDLLAFTWNIKTVQGQREITDMVEGCVNHVDPRKFVRDGPAEDTPDGVSAWW